MSESVKMLAPQKSRDTIKVLRELLAQAEAGDLVGFAYSAMFRERLWSYGSTGEASRNPAFTIGLMQIQQIDLAHQLTGGFSDE